MRSSLTFRKPMCVHTRVCGSVYVCVPVHATASMWSEHSLGCLSLPPTVFEKGSYVVHCCIHLARWSMSITSPPPTSPVSTILWCTPHYHSCLYVFCFFLFKTQFLTLWSLPWSLSPTFCHVHAMKWSVCHPSQHLHVFSSDGKTIWDLLFFLKGFYFYLYICVWLCVFAYTCRCLRRPEEGARCPWS